MTPFERRVLAAIEANPGIRRRDLPRVVYADAGWVKTWAGRNGHVDVAVHHLVVSGRVRTDATGLMHYENPAYYPKEVGAS